MRSLVRFSSDPCQIYALRTELAKHTVTKTKQGRIEQEWIARVILAAPHASGRALAQAFRDVAGFKNEPHPQTS